MTINIKTHINRYWWVWAIVAGLALRLPVFLLRPLWGDEITSHMTAFYAESIGHLVEIVRVSPHPPLSSFLMRFWTHVAGLEQMVIRLPSIIIGISSIWGIYYFSKKLFRENRVAYIATTILTTISILHIQYSIEAKSYIPLFWIGLIGVYVFIQIINSEKWNLLHVFLFAVMNIFAMYFRYETVFFVAVVYLVLFLSLWSSLFRQWLGVSSVHIKHNSIVFFAIIFGTIIAYLPWLPVVFREYGSDFKSLGLIRVERDSNPYFFWDWLTQIFWLPEGHIDKLNIFSQVMGRVVVMVFVILALQKLWQHRGRFIQTQKNIILVAVIICGYLVLYFFSPFAGDYTARSARHLMIILPMIFILLGWAFSYIDYKKAYILGSIFVISLFVPMGLYFKDVQTPFDSSWKQLTQSIVDKNAKTDKILFDGHALGRMGFNYYAERIGVSLAEQIHFLPKEEIEEDYSPFLQTPSEQLAEIYVTQKQLEHPQMYFTSELEQMITGVDSVWVIQHSPELHRRTMIWLCVNGWSVEDFVISNNLEALLLKRLPHEQDKEHINKCLEYIP